jgi:hypothetical protein
MLIVVEWREKKRASVVLFGLLFFSLLTVPLLVNSAKANPYKLFYVYDGTVSPDLHTEPPAISIFAPKNHSACATNVVLLSVNVSVGESSTADFRYIDEVYYEADWQKKENRLYEYDAVRDPEPPHWEIEFKSLRDGNYSLVVYAKERGGYYGATSYSGPIIDQHYNLFEIDGSSTVFFTVDTSAPSVSVLSLQNETFYSPNFDLNFVVDEPTSRSTYSLDGNDNVTVAGNTTLTGMPIGVHNVTVYAWDTAGNVGASESVTFTIKESFPTLTVATASVVSLALVGAVLMVYFKKRIR